GPRGAAVEAYRVHRRFHTGGAELRHDLLVERPDAVLQRAGAVTVSGVKRREQLGAEPGGVTGDRDDAAIALQLERRQQQRPRPDKDCPLRRRLTVGGEVLQIPRRILGAHDARVGGKLLQQLGRERDVSVLRDVVDQDRYRARVGDGPGIVRQCPGGGGGETAG